MIQFYNSKGWNGCGFLLNISLNAYAGAALTTVVSAVAASVFESSYACAVAAIYGTFGAIALATVGTGALLLFCAAITCIQAGRGRPLTEADVVG